MLISSSNQLYYLHSDHPSAALRTSLGSTSAVTCGSTSCSPGSVIARQRYYPFGSVRPGGTGTLPTDRTFTGQTADASTGLMYYVARYYDPLTGRFISADTIVPEPGNPQSLNRYAYSLSNPLKYTDPTGHWVETAWDIANIVWDIHEVQKDPSFINIAALVVDVATAILPAVPAGAGLIVRSGKLATTAIDAAAHTDEVVEAVRAAGHLGDGVHAALSAAHALDAAQKLTRAGLNSAEGADLVRTIAAASAQNGRVQNGVTLLGTFPEYVDLAKTEGMTYFNLSDDVWSQLKLAGDDYVWAVNKQFLDDSIAAGHSFVITSGGGYGHWLKREIMYLINEKGYRWIDGVLTPP